jgi:hypothetical protein
MPNSKGHLRSNKLRVEMREQIREANLIPQCTLARVSKGKKIALSVDGKPLRLDIPMSLAFQKVMELRDNDPQKALDWVLLADPFNEEPWTSGPFRRLTERIWRQEVLSNDHWGMLKMRVVKGQLLAHRARRNPVRRSQFLYTNEIVVRNVPEGFTLESEKV